MEGFHNDFHGIMLGILNEKKNKKASLIHFEVTIPVKKKSHWIILLNNSFKKLMQAMLTIVHTFSINLTNFCQLTEELFNEG